MTLRLLRALGVLTLGLLSFVPSDGLCQGFDGPSFGFEILPDLCPVKSYLYQNYLWIDGGDTYLRITNGIANVGQWELFFEPYGPVDPETGTRPARQRVGLVLEPGDTTITYHSAGEFEYHSAPCHDHIHLGKVAEYVLREYISESEVGDSLAAGDKVGFCLEDVDQYEEDECCGPVPANSPQSQVFTQCNRYIENYFTEGISKGWADVYRYFLAGQRLSSC